MTFIKGLRFVPAIGMLVLLAAPTISNASTFNLTSNFSTAANPNGAWSYGYETTLNGSFNPYNSIYHWNNGGSNGAGTSWYSTNYASSHLPAVWILTASQPWAAIGQTEFHPGSDGSLSVVRWTSPTSGEFHVTGSFGAGDSSGVYGAMSYYTAFNGSIVDRQINDPNGYNFDFTKNVSADNTIDFIVGMNTNYGNLYGSTPISANITSVGTTPLPSAWTMMLAGLAAFGFVAYPRRKRRAPHAAV